MAKKVLVVDDDPGILEAFRAILESADYDVVTTSDPEGLESLLRKSQPDLILLDVLLSGVDGRDVCKTLKSKNSTKKIPIIMVSAHPGASKSVAQVGADDFLEKPFEMDDLLKKVEKFTDNIVSDP